MKKVFQGKKILITGHTGFKGSWLSLILKLLGNNVYGLSDNKINSGFYKIIKNKDVFTKEYQGDIRDPKYINKIIGLGNFEIVFHLAAQGLVSVAAKNPENTLTSNILGTFNILNSCNNNKRIKTLIVSTTDKVYAEHNSKNSELFKLGGKEFYSASKASTEHIITAFINTHKRDTLNIGVVRAGNVLGGGDYGKDRLLTDVINSLKRGENIKLRNPQSLRPWQYILDSLMGYLLVAQYCQKQKKDEIFNLNRKLNNQYDVGYLVDTFVKEWSPTRKIKIIHENSSKFYESDVLRIDSTKARKLLNWVPSYNLIQICKNTVLYEKSNNKYDFAVNHISEYLDKYIKKILS